MFCIRKRRPSHLRNRNLLLVHYWQHNDCWLRYGVMRARRIKLIILAAAVTILGIVLAVRRVRSPDFICRRALEGIQNKDAQLLLSLADDEEVRTLHLTEAGVYKVLNATVWKVEIPKLTATRDPQSPDDVAKWRVLGYPRPFDILAIGSPDRGWKLNLSLLLFTCCYGAARDDSYWDQWHLLETEAGIAGTLDGYGSTYRLRDGRLVPARQARGQ